ncbi:hypothetical protein B9Z55_021026 [Caenorhabditis nigoni]|uniref:7TM GPCR serpentine receptor class x (Srx) domain-containing protein n=1 Tax=Caenorhabditis nigoni TaxID=1611254 RepID=A0A2G5TQE7_9PELO|nr:hypothetical protein B9Z55_021026 [Caenorhabditis nigoni]
MSDKVIQLKSPKLGCIPVRPFLIFISFLELLWTLSYLTTEPPSTINFILGAASFMFNVSLVYGTLKYNDKALSYSQICVIFAIITNNIHQILYVGLYVA